MKNEYLCIAYTLNLFTLIMAVLLVGVSIYVKNGLVGLLGITLIALCGYTGEKFMRVIEKVESKNSEL